VSALENEYAEHLAVREAYAVGAAGPLRADGLVPIHIIRPGVGRGKGRHLYEARMLEEHAAIFKNWKMFVDHQAPEAKRAAGGLPRSIRDLGGIIKESWWDASVPADPQRGHGQGAVVGLARPTPLIRQLIETDPALVEASISATATSVRPIQAGGKTAWLVEGLNPTGSVDWVSMAGAGGKVVQLAEALEESLSTEEGALMLLESMGDEDFLAHLESSRPDLFQVVLREAKHKEGEEKPNGETELNETTTEEVEDVKTPIEVLTEALDTDEGKALVEGIVEKRFAEIAAPKLAELVEAAVEEEREVITAEATARSDRKLQVRDLEKVAQDQIAEAKLPDTFKRELTAKYALSEAGVPSVALDVTDEKDEKGEVTKTAKEQVTEAVAADIKAKQAQAAELAPTTVRGQGGRAAVTEAAPDAEPDEDDPAYEKKKKATKPEKEVVESTGSEDTDYLLRSAGVEIDESLYEGILP